MLGAQLLAAAAGLTRELNWPISLRLKRTVQSWRGLLSQPGTEAMRSRLSAT